MKKWSRQIVLTALSAFLGVMAPNSAKAMNDGNCNSCEPYGCDDSCSAGSFEIGGELIWWKPALDHLEYAILAEEVESDVETVKLKYHTLCPDWEAGGRVWVYAPSCFCDSCGIGASWTGICSKDSTSTSVSLNNGKAVLLPRELQPGAG